jgi:hypothetical protein
MKSWKDITLRQAQELLALDPKDYTEDLQFEIEQLSILLNEDPIVIEGWTPSKVIDTFKEYDFIKKLPIEKLTEEIQIGDVTYKQTPLDELILAQMVDIEEYVNLGVIDNIHNIMSCLWLDEPEYKPSKQRAESILDLDMETVYGNLLFFYHIVTTYTTNIQDSLMTEKIVETTNQLTKMRKEMEDPLKK